MTIKNQAQRKVKLAKYIQQLDEFNWHHPAQVNEMADSQFERDQTRYYLAQMSLVLFNNYQQSYMKIGQMLNMSSRTALRLVNSYNQDFESLDEILEKLQDGEDW